jgi:predicted transcriptional regulator
VSPLAQTPVSQTAKKSSSSRHSLLDLAPLELDCMNTLWPMGQGTVREIRDGLATRRARAYTTIMTIMDRLARKGIVERQKAGRAYIYRPLLTAVEARSQALGQVLESFFGGSEEALLAHLGSASGALRAVSAVAAGSLEKPEKLSGSAAIPAVGFD